MEPHFVGAAALVDIPSLSLSPGRAGEPLVRLLRLRDVLELVPVSKSGWFAGINAGRFPRGRHISPRVTVWRSDEISQLIDAVGKASPAKAGRLPASTMEEAPQIPTRRYRNGKEV